VQSECLVDRSVRVNAQHVQRQASELAEAAGSSGVPDADDTQVNARLLQVRPHGHELLAHLCAVKLAELRQEHDESLAAPAAERRGQAAVSRIDDPRGLKRLKGGRERSRGRER